MEPSTPSDKSSERQDYDQALKKLLQRGHNELLALLIPGATFRTERSPELPATARQADLVWEVERRNGKPGLVHIELQTKIESDIADRVLDYVVRLWLRDHLPVYSIVIFLRLGGKAPPMPLVIVWNEDSDTESGAGQHERLRFVYDVIRLWEVPSERVLETQQYILWPLAGLMADASAGKVANTIERLTHAPLNSDERDELIRTLILLAGMRIPHEELARAMRRAQLKLNLWEESSLKEALADLAREEGLEEGLAEGIVKGREEGLSEGREEGREEGETERTRSMALSLLAARFGPLSDELAAAINAADAATLMDMVPTLATGTLADVHARFGLQ